MHLGERIRQLRKKHSWQQKELALKLNCPQSTVSMWETKKQEPNPSMRKKICAIFGITQAELFADSCIKETCSTQSAPVLNWNQLNQLAPLKDSLPKNSSNNYIYTSVKGNNIFSLEINDDRMSPEFKEGDTIIINPNAQINPNDYIIILDKESETSSITQFKKYGDKIIFHPLNPKYHDLEMIDKSQYIVVGKVDEKIKKY
ncbi:MAG: XRE family transcriptional regulator [Candidatus Omnitrophota bacterium]|nr:XRE family transcriptional regulator [Candidatus Omnitrophota bacterium]